MSSNEPSAVATSPRGGSSRYILGLVIGVVGVVGGLVIAVVIGILEFLAWCQREGAIVALDGSLVGVRPPSTPWLVYLAFATLGALSLLLARARPTRPPAGTVRPLLAGGVIGLGLAAWFGAQLTGEVLDHETLSRSLHMASRSGVLYLIAGSMVAALGMTRSSGADASSSRLTSRIAPKS